MPVKWSFCDVQHCVGAGFDVGLLTLLLDQNRMVGEVPMVRQRFNRDMNPQYYHHSLPPTRVLDATYFPRLHIDPAGDWQLHEAERAQLVQEQVYGGAAFDTGQLREAAEAGATAQSVQRRDPRYPRKVSRDGGAGPRHQSAHWRCAHVVWELQEAQEVEFAEHPKAHSHKKGQACDTHCCPNSQVRLA
eukprot:2437818-Prymnesium_polylepis.1